MVEHSQLYRSLPNAKHVREFIEEFQQLAPNQHLFIYTNTAYWQSHVKMDLRNFKHVHLWLAWWTDTSGEIGTMRTMLPSDAWSRRIGGLIPTIIQFTSQARVGDVRVRGNLYDGDIRSLQRLALPALPEPIATLAFKDRFRSPVARVPIAPNPKTKTKLVTGSVVLGIVAIVIAAALVALSLGKERWAGIFEENDDR